MENLKEINDNWNQIKAKLKERIFQLTENDLLFSNNSEDDLPGMFQLKPGKTREEIRNIIYLL